MVARDRPRGGCENHVRRVPSLRELEIGGGERHGDGSQLAWVDLCPPKAGSRASLGVGLGRWTR